MGIFATVESPVPLQRKKIPVPMGMKNISVVFNEFNTVLNNLQFTFMTYLHIGNKLKHFQQL